jgi:hypothetical protein
MISEGHKADFEMLKKAFKYKDVCLVECTDATTKKPVVVLAATQRGGDGSITMVPFAKFFDGNPYEELIPPHSEA